ncbi:MAG: hypothetical protein APF76_11105 [Desulfitibacter sp. BRH_c19]|nr:MAG: hypothetical protein APF76_11105 [Desulfitibacter sp. BRH_c19]
MENFTEIYKRYKLMIYRYFLYLTTSDYLAEELTQETFYQVYVSYGEFKGGSSISTWIIAIARRVYLKYLRQDKKQLTLENGLDEVCAAIDGLPEVILDNKEFRKEILDTLQLLPEIYRSVIILREIEERSFEEIAAVLGKSPSSIRVILHRAKKRFRELFNAKIG